MRHAKSLITLAVACLLAVPAFSMPWTNGTGYGGRFDQMNLIEEEMENMTLAELRELRQENNTDRCPMNNGQMGQCSMNKGQMDQCPMNKGQMGGGYGGAFLLMTDLTEEEMKSMTLAELKELREEKIDELSNMTAEEIEELKEQKRAEMENMTLAELKEQRQEKSDRPFLGGRACLLITDLTTEDLENMTLAEIEALKQEKMDELNNMTLGEIEELNEQKKAEMENMTLTELKGQMEVCRTLGLGGLNKDHMMGPQGCQGGQFGMAGAANYNSRDALGCQQNQCGMAGTGFKNQMNGPGSDGQGFWR
ncbi:MAG TPA: hypothetical protein HA349_01260 [Methanotrichaceae archaeon]|nr:hypothetical protein [Methanotrichaceae archaeon]